MPAPRSIVAALAATVVLAAGCGGDTTESAPTTPASTPAVQGRITVFAAASLSEAFGEVATAFTAANPNATVTFSFDASSTLARQIVQSAPADVFASADTANMDELAAAGLVDGAPVVFATNRLQIIVGPGNPRAITGVGDLAKPGLKTVVCAPEVPCGRYAKQAVDAAKVTLRPVSLEQNVKGVVTKVTAGEADAGIVYATDVRAAGAKATGVDIPTESNVVARYPIATVKGSTTAPVAAAFIALLTGPDGRAILARYGFSAP